MQAPIEFELTCPGLSCSLPSTPVLKHHIQGLSPEIGRFEALRSPAGKVWLVGREAVLPKELEEVLWKQFFADTSQWWDNRRTKPTPRHPDFRHKQSKVPLWLNSRHKPAWVDPQLATMDAGVKSAREAEHTSVDEAPKATATKSEDHVEVGICKKLCDDGFISNAVDGLERLVQRGCHVPCILVYRVLKRCIQMKNLALGRRIHAVTVRSMYKGDAFLATHLISLYASHGRLKEAMEVFAEVPVPDAYNWAAIILAHARNVETGNPAEAIRLYRQMCKSTAIRPDDRLYSVVLKACAAAKDLIAGKEVHSHILTSAGQPDKFVQAGLVNMYAKCGSLDDARNIFDKLSDKNVVTWTAMIAGYAQQGKGQDALSLYRSMQSEDVTPPDSVTYVCLLQACASVGLGALGEGKELHRKIKEQHLEDDVIVGGSLVNMYAKCGRLKEARSVFDKLPNKHVVTWTALIAGYAQHGLGEDALSLFSSMQRKGLTPPDSVTYVCLLQACASVGAPALEKGKQLHAQIREGGRQDDAILGGSLVNMYVKCGSLEEARIVFDKLSNRGVVTWTAMITGYAQEGMGQEALSLYRSMQQEGLTPPDTVIYGCLLQACAAAAALPMGEKLHAEMEERGMPVDGSVGAALVNMYAKCGSMCASQKVFDSLSEKSLEAWGALVSGYARHGESQVVFHLLDRMRLEGVNPDEITFLSVLTVCSHAGLVDEGRKYFEAMRRDYGIRPATKHYICMVDLLGRAGHLHEALQMAKSMPFPATDVLWLTLLGACQKWRDVEIGQLAFQGAISVDERNSAAYVLMSNIYASTAMWEAAEEMQTRRMKFGARKEPGQSWWTDLGGVVHTLCVGDELVA